MRTPSFDQSDQRLKKAEINRSKKTRQPFKRGVLPQLQCDGLNSENTLNRRDLEAGKFNFLLQDLRCPAPKVGRIWMILPDSMRGQNQRAIDFQDPPSLAEIALRT